MSRSQNRRRPHPMRSRSGELVEARLRQCSLYDPYLDLAVETGDGDVAGYALFWFDPVTKVGLVEPMRVEDAYQRGGLARAMLTAGLDRLARRGASRFTVGYATDVPAALALRQRITDTLGVEVAVNSWSGRGLLRLSAQVYNRAEEYEALAEKLPAVLRAG